MGDTFAGLIGKGASAADIAAHLDRLDSRRRIRQVRACGAGLQKKLWNIARGHARLDVASFVPEPDRTVVYCGRNSLPVFKIFEKRFWRPGAGGEVVGYNHQTMSVATGPGYFVTRDSADGEILFDYTADPRLQPPGWPDIKPNKGLVAGAVYGGMIDYNRRVSKHTVIGSATRKGKPMGAFYLLTR